MSCYCLTTNRAIANLLNADFAPTADALTKQFFIYCHEATLTSAVTPTPKPLDLPIFIMTQGSDNACVNLDLAITKVAVERDRCDAVIASVPADSKAYAVAQQLRDTIAGALNAMREAQDNASC